MKIRKYNFGAGPATLPEPILQEAQAELLNWRGLGISVLEIGHRTDEIVSLMSQAEADLRELITIPKNYNVLFLGLAARTQFALVPMNLLRANQKAGYLNTGVWSQMAFEEACKLKHAYCLASTEKDGFINLPNLDLVHIQKNTRYVYYTPNETINGVRFNIVPMFDDIPLVADMTSCLLSEPIDVTKYGLIFAGAQKNIANAGLTIVIIRDDLLEQLPEPAIPTMFDYRTHVEHHSLYATPPVFNCYLAAKMFQWVKSQGGVEALYEINKLKAKKLYTFIDESTLYYCRVEKNARSLMNVCFSLHKPELEEAFLSQANERGLYALKGHRMAGGLRASLYNAMPMEGVIALIEFMHDFQRKN